MSYTPIDDIPTGLRSMDQSAFDAAMAGFMTKLPTTITQINTANSQANASAIAAAASQVAASDSQLAAANSQAIASAAATTATSAPGTSATSTTSLAVGVGNKSFTIQTGKLYVPGNYVTIASTASPDNLMSGNVTAHNSTTGAMTVNVSNFKGSGTFAAWTIALAGAPGLTGIVNEQKGSDIPSASTINLDAANGNFLHITGTATINTVILASGAERDAVIDGVLTMVNSASLILPGGVNYLTAAGDRARFRGDGSVVRVTITPAGGQAPAPYPVMYVRDEKATGTDGGTATINAYNNRTLNTVVLNTIPGASLASDQFTLPPGTYEITAAAPNTGSNAGWVELYNVTDSVIAAIGPNVSQIQGPTIFSPCSATITISAQKSFRIRQWVQSTGGQLGTAVNGSGRPEIYSTVKIEKVR